MTDTDIHSCGYYCDRPLCIKTQRDELRNKLFSDQAVRTHFESLEGAAGAVVAMTQDRSTKITDTPTKLMGPNLEGILNAAGFVKQKEWVGLTSEEIMEITGVTSADSDWNVTIVNKWIRAIEAKLKEKNT
jgi:hypothetical protein